MACSVAEGMQPGPYACSGPSLLPGLWAEPNSPWQTPERSRAVWALGPRLPLQGLAARGRLRQPDD